MNCAGQNALKRILHSKRISLRRPAVHSVMKGGSRDDKASVGSAADNKAENMPAPAPPRRRRCLQPSRQRRRLLRFGSIGPSLGAPKTTPPLTTLARYVN